MKLLKLIANLGYGSRKEVTALFREGRITSTTGEVLYADDQLGTQTGTQVAYEDILVDDEPLDPPPGVLIMLHKPVGYTCSTKDHGALIYDLLPPRFLTRAPIIAPVGRLDRDTSGLLLLTDDGPLLHRITSPRHKLPKVYEVTLARDLNGDETKLFASGKLKLESEHEPCAPATLEVIDSRHCRLTLTEGRYHQARRMFAAVGNHVEALHRARIGGLTLDDLPIAEWQVLDATQRDRLFAV